jgi:hypothetical protein
VASAVILDVPEETQHVLTAGLLCAEQLCSEAVPGMPATQREARTALNLVPGSVAWVQRLAISPRITPRTFAERSAPTMVRFAVEGLVQSAAPDRDLRLRTLLETAIAACPPTKQETRATEATTQLRIPVAR